MGTRHLTQVNYNNETKVAQYGQWDGYIEGNGFVIFDFLRVKENVDKLKEATKKIRFINYESDVIVDKYNENAENNKLTPEQIKWFNDFISRDVGGDILLNIINSESDEIVLRDSSDFKNDTLFCEYYYIIDLDNMTININGYKQYDINNLPNNESILKDFTE